MSTASAASRLPDATAVKALSGNYLVNLKLALDAISAHKFRAFLTVLGVVIGVLTVIVIASILTGLRQNIVTLVEEFGVNNLFIFHRSTGIQFGRPPREELMRKPLKVEDAEAIKKLCPSVQDIAWEGFAIRNSLKVRYQSQESTSSRVQAVTSNYETISNVAIAEGRFFSYAEDFRKASVCVLGADAAKALFPNGNAIEKVLDISGNSFLVVGVAEKRKGGFLGENEDDSAIYIPYQTFHRQYPNEDWLFITAKAFEGKREQAKDEVEEILRRQRKVAWSEPNNFSISTADSFIKQFDSITAGVGIIAIAISGVGLLVGGIGVMNIMLVSVTERTKEIGVRKAIGARKTDIVLQFLVEAMSLTGLGGILGVILAVITAWIVGLLVPSLPTSIPIWAVATGLIVSVMIGLCFGVWPAMKAAKLDPIEALRYE